MKELTKQEIARSLLELMAQKNLNKITIEEISSGAGVNRHTFYYHFRDIIDLLEWICKEKQKVILEDKNTFNNWQESFLKIFEGCQKDKIFIMNIYRNAPTDLLTTHLYNLVYPVIFQVIDEKARNFKISAEDEKFIVDFYKFAFVALVLDWIKNNMEEDPATIIKRIGILLQGTVEHSLNNMGKRIS